MGNRFGNEDASRQLGSARERHNELVRKRVDLLCAYLRDRSRGFPEFAREYRSMPSLSVFDIPIRAQWQDLEYACPRLRNRNHNTWATMLSRLFFCEPEQYAKLKAISPFAGVHLVALGPGTKGAFPSLTLTGPENDVHAVHALIETGKARFRKIRGTNIYAVSKAKYAPEKESRDFRDG